MKFKANGVLISIGEHSFVGRDGQPVTYSQGVFVVDGECITCKVNCDATLFMPMENDTFIFELKQRNAGKLSLSCVGIG